MATKKCKYCKSEIDAQAVICPFCRKQQKTRGLGCLAAVGVLAGIGIIGAFAKMLTEDPSPAPEQPSVSVTDSATTTTTSAMEAISYEAELSDGYYTAGIDFPAGKYDVEVISGNGNVSSDNLFDGGINAVMGVSEEYDIYQKSYQNISLPQGVCLRIRGGLCVKISTEKADPQPLQPRDQSITETVTLSNGYFVAGEDFPAGVYDIIAIDGNGNVQADNVLDDGINAIMGVSDASELYVQEVKNVPLEAGITLHVRNLTVELVPSK